MMNKLWIGLFAVIGVLIGTIGFGAYLAYAASQLYASDLAITELRDVSNQGITFSGQLTITNPSKVAILVKQIQYTIVLENTHEEIARGTLNGGVVEPGNFLVVPIQQETTWLPPMNALLSLASEEKVYLRIQGKGDVSVMGIPLSGSIQERVDVKPLVMQWLEKKREELMKQQDKFFKGKTNPR